MKVKCRLNSKRERRVESGMSTNRRTPPHLPPTNKEFEGQGRVGGMTGDGPRERPGPPSPFVSLPV